jgi:hypothetical protein
MPPDIQNFEKEEITRNQADLDLSETSIEVFSQSSCKKWSFIHFKLIVSMNSTVFHPLSFRNLKIFIRPMVAWLDFLHALKHYVSWSPIINDGQSESKNERIAETPSNMDRLAKSWAIAHITESVF